MPPDVQAVVKAVMVVLKASPEWHYLCRLYARHQARHYAKAWDEKQHPRKDNGEFGSGGSSKPATGKKPSSKPKKPDTRIPYWTPDEPPTSSEVIVNHVRFGQVEQRHAEGNQDKLAKALPHATAIPGNAPSDVEQTACQPKPCHRHQIEMKTLLSNKRGRVKMTAAAQARKLERLAQEPPAVRRQWTVAVDNRHHYENGTLDAAQVFPCYVREGTGSFKITSMHKINSAEELETLLNTPPEKLPEAAKAPTTGFYATWMKSSPTKRHHLAKQAYERERQEVLRHQERHRKETTT